MHDPHPILTVEVRHLRPADRIVGFDDVRVASVILSPGYSARVEFDNGFSWYTTGTMRVSVFRPHEAPPLVRGSTP